MLQFLYYLASIIHFIIVGYLLLIAYDGYFHSLVRKSEPIILFFGSVVFAIVYFAVYYFLINKSDKYGMAALLLLVSWIVVSMLILLLLFSINPRWN